MQRADVRLKPEYTTVPQKYLGHVLKMCSTIHNRQQDDFSHPTGNTKGNLKDLKPGLLIYSGDFQPLKTLINQAAEKRRKKLPQLIL